ncbi:MAG: HPr family phosphocarrier protein [Myxococcota bacterium]
MTEEACETFEVVNELGLHARAAAKLVQMAERFASKVEVEKGGQRVDAKSVMGLLLLCGTRGSKLTVYARGSDASEAVEAIGRLIAGRFGEER